MKEADEFYSFCPARLSDDARMVQRQAFAGLLWSKQFYHYVVEQWLKGDPPCLRLRRSGNSDGIEVGSTFYNDDIISMPDKWEYPWYAAWDLAFHTIPFALIDPDFAKHQLSLLLREWYQSPNGQLPAYEWEFSDVNPPVHPWPCTACLRSIRRYRKSGLSIFGSRVPQAADELHLVVNRKILKATIFSRAGFSDWTTSEFSIEASRCPLEASSNRPTVHLDGNVLLTMLRIAIELTPHDAAYEDIASKFFEHFLYISSAMNQLGDAASGTIRTAFSTTGCVCRTGTRVRCGYDRWWA